MMTTTTTGHLNEVPKMPFHLFLLVVLGAALYILWKTNKEIK